MKDNNVEEIIRVLDKVSFVPTRNDPGLFKSCDTKRFRLPLPFLYRCEMSYIDNSPGVNERSLCNI